MHTVPVIIPVRYREQKGSRLEQHVGFVEASVKHASEDEAPVAVRWSYGRKTLEYRAFDGSLWHRLTDRSYNFANTDETLTPFGKDAPMAEWVKRARSADTAMKVLFHPIASRRPWAKTFPNLAHLVVDPTPTGSAEFIAASRETLSRAADTMVVGSAVWERGTGPVIDFTTRARNIENDGPELAYSPNDGRSDSIDGRAYRFDGLAPEAAIRAVHRHFGKMPAITGERPQVLIEDGYSTDPISLVTESTAWHMVWMSKDLPLADVPPPALDAISALRTALGARWPGHELDFHPAFHESTWNHLYGNPVPDGADLLPAIARMEAACAGLVADPVARCWRMNVERIRDALGLHADLDDDMVLAGLEMNP